MKLGLAVLRTVVGALFMGHGLQKLMGWFGGYGLKATGQAFEGMGLRPGTVNAAAAGASETAGGALLAAGLFTPVGAMLVTATMATAVREVHGPKGPWATQGGYEYNLVLMAIVFALADAGPGDWSLDEALGTARSGPAWALAQLLAGLVGSAGVHALGARGASAGSDAPVETAANAPSADPASPGGAPA